MMLWPLLSGAGHNRLWPHSCSGPVFQGELELEVSEDMTINEFNRIKNDIQNRIKEIFPEIERITIAAITKK